MLQIPGAGWASVSRIAAVFVILGQAVPTVETNTRKIIARLEKEGWVNVGGGKHDRLIKNNRPGVMITVPRHKELTPGTARSIAKAAGWI